MTVIQLKRGLAATWASINPILSPGEFGYETDTGKYKLGNGSAAWNSLPYAPREADKGQPNGIASLDSSGLVPLEQLPITTADWATLDGKPAVVAAGATEADARAAIHAEYTGNKGQANGYAGLDGGGKVPVTQLPSSIMQYQGVWNANTNSPTLVDGTGNTGDVYRVATGGSQDLGSGSITFNVGDYAIYNGSTWEKSDTTDAVASVNGYTGNVTLTASDLGLPETTAYTTTVGDGTSTSVTVTHNLNTRNVVVSVKDSSTYAEVECDVMASSDDAVTLTFATPPTVGQYIVTVLSDGIMSSPTTTSWLSSSTIKDDTDQTKQFSFQVSGISTGTTRTLAVPDANTTLVGTDATQTLTNKDLSSGTNTFPAFVTASESATITNKNLTSGTNTFPSSLVTLTGSQALSNKTLTNPTVTGYTEAVNALGTVTSSATLSLTSGTVQTATLTASTTCTFTMPTAVAGQSFVLMLKQAATTGNGAATFTGVKWSGGTAPTITAAAGKMDILSFFSDGTNWYGSTSQNYTP